jgi:branched-chain amino acid transport system permease protein
VIGLIRPRLWMLTALALLAALPWIPPFESEGLRRWLAGAALLGGFAVAFDFTAGYINVVNFGFAAFSGVGAYASSLLAIHLGVSPFVTQLAGLLAGGVLGFFTGLLTLRFRGIYAAVVAWFLGLVLMGLTRNLTPITRGSLGLISPTFLSTNSNMPYYYVAAAMLVITYLILRRIVLSPAGLAFRAIGQNMEAARASGINPTGYRVLNFTVSCTFAGWLGAFYAHYYGVLTPQVMDTSHTVEVLIVAYLGGRGSLWGPAVMAFPYVFLTQWMRSSFSRFPGLDLVIYGIALIAVTIFYPGGLAGLVGTLRRVPGAVATAPQASSPEVRGVPALSEPRGTPADGARGETVEPFTAAKAPGGMPGGPG